MKYADFLKWTGLGAAVILMSACGRDEESAAAAPAPADSSAQPATASNDVAESVVSLESVDERVSYGLGYNYGASIANEGGIEVSLPALVAGLEDGLALSDPRLDEESLIAAFMSLQERAQQAATSPEAEAHLETAQDWLRENGRREEVTVLNSGLQYEVIESGPEGGTSPGPQSVVEVHYHGTLTDGTVFDSSIDRGESVEFPLNRVIAGWTEGLQLMSEGDRWRLFIPPHLGYGPQGSGNRIPPNAALIFEVQLIDVR